MHSHHPIYQAISPWLDEIIAIRRDFHQHPEEGFDTPRTCGIIAEKLRAWGVETVDTELCQGAVVAVVEGLRPGPSIGIRGDMDCLPMPDLCGHPWQSENSGKAHACGHDAHASYLLGLARYFQEHRDFAGRIVFAFQPAEEKGKGAGAMVAAGFFDKYPVEEIFCAHADGRIDVGQFATHAGPTQASCDAFFITIHGKGTHGSMPHGGIDPIPVGTQIVNAFQSIITRRKNPMDQAVLSVCSINAGSMVAFNISPDTCTISGTVRTFKPEVQDLIEKKMRDIALATCEMNDCTCEFDYRRLVGQVSNDPELVDAAHKAAVEVFGVDVMGETPPYLGSEDFAEFLKVVPGMVIRIGVRDENHTVYVHNSRFDFNDAAMGPTITLLAQLALNRLDDLAKR